VSTATVRAAVADFVTTAAVPGVGKVYRAIPYWADGADWKLDSKLGNGAVVAVHIVEDAERRNTLPAITGQKRVDYTVGLAIYYQWLIPSASQASHSTDDWVDGLDQIIDALKAAIRQAPTLNDSTVIFQAGQGRIHETMPDLTTKQGMPRRGEGKVLCWSVVELGVTEIIEG
jgi:hypothetical protein